jgi:hypothetical protein
MSKNWKITRKSFLKGAGVAITLPWLEAMMPSAYAKIQTPKRKRLVMGVYGLGWHAEDFFPKEAGRNYTAPHNIKPIEKYRDSFTIVQGLTNSSGGHASIVKVLACTPYQQGQKLFSVDQLVAETFGKETRFPSLNFSAKGTFNISWNRAGVPQRAITDCQQMFDLLFKKSDNRTKEAEFKEQESILDGVIDEANRLSQRLGAVDRRKLDQYLYSIREAEKEIERQRFWMTQAKPNADKPYKKVPDAKKYFENMNGMYKLMALALQTDSTRVMTFQCFEQNLTDLPDVKKAYHGLSHHGKDPENLKLLQRIENQNMVEFSQFLDQLASIEEEGESLLDSTIVTIGSNLGNANNHSGLNLPSLVVGGGFKHGQHLVKEPLNSTPLANLYVSLLEKLEIENDGFGDSTGSLEGFV